MVTVKRGAGYYIVNIYGFTDSLFFFGVCYVLFLDAWYHGIQAYYWWNVHLVLMC